MGLLWCVQPALLTTISTAPPFLWAQDTASLISLDFVTSPCIEKPSKSAATCAAPAPLRSMIVTQAPCAAKVRAIAAPNPEAPPVMSADFPLSLICSNHSNLLLQTQVINCRPLFLNHSIFHTEKIQNHNIKSLTCCSVISKCARMNTTETQMYQHCLAPNFSATNFGFL